MNLTYTKVGDYLMPNLSIPKQEKIHLGKFAQMRLDYLKNNKMEDYEIYLMTNTLTKHLVEIQKQATEMMETIMEQLEARDNLTEEMKNSDFLTWVGMKNNHKMIAEEQVMQDLIYN